MVPVGEQATFVCKIRSGINPHWNINNRAISYDESVTRIAGEGYFIYERVSGSMATLTLRVNVTADKNGTEIYCSSLYTHSESAFLIVITGDDS